MLGIRFDIVFAVFVIFRFGFNFIDAHWIVVKRIFRYLRSFIDLCLTYRRGLQSLFDYSDADWTGDVDIRRFTFGYIFNLGSGVISWFFKRQKIVVLSTCEVEYRAQTEVGKEALWLKDLITQLSFAKDNSGAVVIHCDN